MSHFINKNTQEMCQDYYRNLGLSHFYCIFFGFRVCLVGDTSGTSISYDVREEEAL